MELVECREIALSFPVEINKLQQEIKNLEFLTMNPVFKHWQGVPLRSASGANDSSGLQLYLSLDHGRLRPCQDSEIMTNLTYIPELIRKLEDEFNTKVGLVRVLKLVAHETIRTHEDGKSFDLATGSIMRLHIPIVTNDQVFFIVNKNKYILKQAKLYYMNVNFPHSVENQSNMDRVHLVIDVVATNSLRQFIFNQKEVALSS